MARTRGAALRRLPFTGSLPAGQKAPVPLGGSGDQFFPWVAALGGKVYASWFNRAGRDDTYTMAGAASINGGAWTAPVALSTVASNVMSGNQFSYPSCLYNFIGDYSAITVDSSGVAHALWTDIRQDQFDAQAGGADQDPFTATLTTSQRSTGIKLAAVF